jgi:hypothetical protein
MNKDSERTRRRELTFGETRLYDLSSIAKPVGKFEESSSLVLVDVCTGLQDVGAEPRVVVTLPPTGELVQSGRYSRQFCRRRFVIDATINIALRL